MVLSTTTHTGDGASVHPEAASALPTAGDPSQSGSAGNDAEPPWAVENLELFDPLLEKPDDSKLSPFSFQQFESELPHDVQPAGIGPGDHGELNICIELGRADCDEEQLEKLQPGSVVRLNQTGDAPVDILAEGRLVARGEVLVLNERFCVRLVELLVNEF